MLRHYITSINYEKLIEQQANSVNNLDKVKSKKIQLKHQNNSKMMVKRMKPISK